jgi:hypothetical protein
MGIVLKIHLKGAFQIEAEDGAIMVRQEKDRYLDGPGIIVPSLRLHTSGTYATQVIGHTPGRLF